MPEVIMNGPEGRLEGRYFPSERKNAPVALVLHPHPKHGGTMNNKIAYNLFQTFASNGFSVLRFNFRGVGRSEGEFDNGVGELCDAATALDWLEMQNPEASSYWIAGFSFGSWLAMQLLMRRPELDGFITIAPPANMYDFTFLAPCPRSGLVLQGDMDSIVPEEDVSKYVNKLNQQKNIGIEYKVISGADHFFRGQIDHLNEHVNDYIQLRMEDIMNRNPQHENKKRRPLPQSA